MEAIKKSSLSDSSRIEQSTWTKLNLTRNDLIDIGFWLGIGMVICQVIAGIAIIMVIGLILGWWSF